MANIKEKTIDPERGDVNEATSDEDVQQLEYVDTNGDDLASVDVQNKNAVKGDDSDGKVDWNWRQRIAVMCLVGLYTGSQIPVYFTAGPLTFITAELGGTASAAWLPVSYGLALAAVVPICGYFQDLLGRRYVCLLGGCLLIIGCIVMGTAHKFRDGLVGMVLCGSGAAIGEMTALAGTSELVPVKRRPIYVAILTVVTLPFIPSVLESQLLAKYYTWRWGYWICLIWNAICFVGLLFTYFPVTQTRARSKDVKRIFTKIDYPGIILSLTGTTLFLVALQAGGYTHSWTSAYVLCQLLIGIVLMVCFVIWEWKYARYPMVPPELFKGQRIVTVAYLVSAVGGINFASLVNLLPTEFSTVYDSDPVQVGLKGLSTGGAILVGAFIGNLLLHRLIRWTREVVLFYLVLMTAFTGAFSIANPDNAKMSVAFATLGGFGVGGIIAPVATIAMMACPDTLIATCAALSLCVRALGGAMGYAIYFNVFNSKLKTALPARVAEYALAAGLPVSNTATFVETFLTVPHQVSTIPGVTPEIIQAAIIGSRWGYSDAFRWVWISSIPFGVCAIIVACFLPNLAKHSTNRIAAKIAH
ncbi:putative major facilitator superfamily transporter [Eremomyces bilateralis CBS 781.70]|uniref:Major facilitator superfamily transporter n=1 Tax=Eremomyces bilateralis CBS 781.70 TaxID=1392243 RepID=A0A6G1FTM4_9PEZI|nr:putative major facilitator superfamily transporter [Eremomyces bilateralis CBS 781.70]KAF1809090.1 putative major facilitator superfamily transporter [Eremomyces bilateralis CBS 781.70]